MSNSERDSGVVTSASGIFLFCLCFVADDESPVRSSTLQLSKLTNHADRIVDQLAIDVAGLYVPVLRRPQGRPDPEPKSSLRFKEVMSSLLMGKRDSNSFTPAMNVFLSPATGKEFWKWLPLKAG